MQTELGRPCTIEELADRAGLKVEKVKWLFSCQHVEPVSINRLQRVDVGAGISSAGGSKVLMHWIKSPAAAALAACVQHHSVLLLLHICPA
eukprot:11113-Heterococcus_DN1.PRE.3